MSSKYSENILFCVNGHGLGNATRVQAIINELENEPCKRNISILATDMAIDFFHSGSKNYKVIPYYSYFRDNPSFLSFLKDIYYLNKKIKSLIKDLQIDSVVTNSIYPINLSKRVRFLALNNSHAGWKSIHRVLTHSSLKSYIIEVFDFLYHQIVPHQTLYIDLRCDIPVKNIIPPIARSVPLKKPGDSILILTGGGENFDDNFFKGLPKKYQYVIHHQMKSHFGLSIEHRKKSYNIFLELSYYKLIICSGGLSSLSEVLQASRPAVIIPQNEHHEQYINALQLTKTTNIFRCVNHANFHQLEAIIDQLLSLPLNHEYKKQCPSGIPRVIKEIDMLD